ncbi:hypothetical protein M422DRAFT_263221, partial [Sphaerobolus stellatus SS14]
MTSKATPLSIEALLQTQKEEREAASKPRFLTKEERAKLAIERRAQEIKQQKEKDDATRAQREALEQQADEIRAKEREHQPDRYRDDRRGSHRYDDRNSRGRDQRDNRDNRRPDSRQSRPAFQNGIPTGPRAERANTGPNSPAPGSGAQSNSQGSNPSGTPASEDYVPPITESDLSAIRSRYLGVDKKKRKIRKINDRKFVFDWDEHEDTFTAEAAGPNAPLAEATGVMFGRGHLAGMDDGGNARRGGANVNLADSMERRKAAKTGIDERHWSDKPLHEMRERDW